MIPSCTNLSQTNLIQSAQHIHVHTKEAETSKQALALRDDRVIIRGLMTTAARPEAVQSVLSLCAGRFPEDSRRRWHWAGKRHGDEKRGGKHLDRRKHEVTNSWKPEARRGT